MKIKKLILRNIASIEEANIDFENGLNDAITGEPASTFLIYGDTGAGKSILLDGIAMALYKTTPRIEDVPAKNKNSYTNTEGESVAINNLMQYTRLGISDKADCYSEVVFDDDKGVEYRAKLTLGYTAGRKYKTPKWTVNVGNEEKEGDKNAGETIRNAIGLTYEQFSRMAMLAQGQFAAFLTGGKAEREEILEKLTQTGHFSEYGEAITNIYSKSKADKVNAQTAYDTIESLLKKEGDPDLLAKDLNLLEKEKESKDSEKKAVDGKLDNIKAIEDSQRKIAAAKSSLEACRATYIDLSSDLLWRKARCEEAEKSLEEPLKGQDDLRALYESAAKVDLQLDNLLSAQQKKSNAEEEKRRLTGLTESLNINLEEKRKAEAAVAEAVNKRQGETKALTEKRNQLDPSGVNKKLNQLSLHKNQLQSLEDSLCQLGRDTASMAELEKTAEDEEKKLNGELLAQKTAAEKEWSEAEKADRKAREYLVTAKMSASETIVNLRRRLHDEHTETCPLCGQHISHLHLDDDFAAFVSPFSEKQKATAERLAAAVKARDEASGRYNSASNALAEKKGKLEASKKKNSETKAKLDATARSLGLDTGMPLLPQIDPLRRKTVGEIETLNEIVEKAKTLQDQIDKLTADKTLDNKLLEATQQRKDAESAVGLNRNNITNHEKTIEETTVAIGQLLAELQPLLDGRYSGWRESPDDTRRKLDAEAKAYLEKKRLYDQQRKALDERKAENIRLAKLDDKIHELCPDWHPADSGRPSPETGTDIHSHWTDLAGRCTSNLDAIRQSNAETAARLTELGIETVADLPDKTTLEAEDTRLYGEQQELMQKIGGIKSRIDSINEKKTALLESEKQLEKATAHFERWNRLNEIFGGNHFRTLVQSHILRPLLENANSYLTRITDRYTLTCSDDNEQLAILVLDNYNRGEIRSVTVLSGGERFMISLALSLALSSLNRPDLNVDILFIDEGFGTLDEKNLNSVMSTLEKLQEIAGQTNRRVGIISHREELEERIPVKIIVDKKHDRSIVEIKKS